MRQIQVSVLFPCAVTVAYVWYHQRNFSEVKQGMTFNISPMIICSERSSVLQSGFWWLTARVVNGIVGPSRLRGPWRSSPRRSIYPCRPKVHHRTTFLPQTWKLFGKDTSLKIAVMESVDLGTTFCSTAWLSPHHHLASPPPSSSLATKCFISLNYLTTTKAPDSSSSLLPLHLPLSHQKVADNCQTSLGQAGNCTLLLG